MDNIFKTVEWILRQDDDTFRAIDLMNSVNENQRSCKEWLLKHLPNPGKTLIIGGWYGYMASHIPESLSVDIDPGCEVVGKKAYPQVKFKTDDGFNCITQRSWDTIICTACEHIGQDDIQWMLDTKKRDTVVALQSNNYYSINEHINCKDSLAEFRDELGLREIIYEGEMDRVKYKRWMVIGK